jgi:hypothetical protein
MHNEAIIFILFKGVMASFSNNAISWHVSCDPQYKNETEDILHRSTQNQQTNISLACLLLMQCCVSKILVYA